MGAEPVGSPMGEPAPQNDMMMGGDMPQDEMPMGDGQGANMDGFGGEQPNGGNSEYDTNFDAGVEADEDTDPKKYIQQLTGKLSTTLNSYNSENADDDGLNKYVAKMIVKASTKNMDEPDKKEVIKAINTSQNDEPVDDKESDDDVNTDEIPSNEAPVDNGDMPQQDEQPIQECAFSKRQIQEMAKRRRK